MASTADLATALEDQLEHAVVEASRRKPRTAQSRAMKLGISDSGFCAEKSRRDIIGEPWSSPENEHSWPAFIGTALGDAIEEAVLAIWPTIERQIEVEWAMTEDLVLTGHPDLVPGSGIIDIKTVDGLTVMRRSGPKRQQRWQRTLYYEALRAAGRLPDDGFVANAWFDRSGREPRPYVQLEMFNPEEVEEAREWWTSVLDAVKSGEEALREQPRELCRRFCVRYAACRGLDDVVPGLLTDPEILGAIDLHVRGKALERAGKSMVTDATRTLWDTSGSTATHSVRWVEVNGSENRAGYSKLDVREVRLPPLTKEHS